MTIRYCGPGGSDAASGLTWPLRKLTLNGVEDTPVVAGDTIYVGPGTYRETLTVDVSGSGGSPVTYIGDYTGVNTDGVGGVVRITGSADDKALTRANCVTANAKHYRTWIGFLMDACSGTPLNTTTGACTNWIVQQCAFMDATAVLVQSNPSGANWLIDRCFFIQGKGTHSIQFTSASAADNNGSVIQNCISLGGSILNASKTGGITINNCVVLGGSRGVLTGSLTAGQTITVTNCIFGDCTYRAFDAGALGEITEDYNNLFNNATDRQNTATGAHSTAYPPLMDPRWFMQLVFAGAGPNSLPQLATPFDLASFSQLINLAGTSPVATDMRGTGSIGAQREWGALEYDATLKIRGGVKKSRVFTGGF